MGAHCLSLIKCTPFRLSKQVFEPGVVLADGEFSGLESVILGAPLEMTNNYMDAIAYNEVRTRADRLRRKVLGYFGYYLQRL